MAKSGRNKRQKVKDRSKAIREEVDMEIGTIDFKSKLEDMMREYGHYVVENRAIPDWHDGMKPVHRRILWSMYMLKAFNSGKTMKTALVSGDVIGKFHPHGSASVDATIAEMVNGAATPTIHGQGNFGSYSEPPAAARYTEIKFLTQTEKLLFNPYYLKVIPMVTTYSGNDMEPVFLPAMLPLVLATGAEGIAVGVTTKLPAFTVKSLHEVTTAILSGETDTKKLAKALRMASAYGGKPTGTWKDIHAVFTTAEASALQWTNDFEIIDDKKMVITGLHPEWSYKSKFLAMRNDPDVVSADNESDKNGIKLTIHIKKSADPDKVFDRLIKLCTGNITYRCNITERRLDSTLEVPEVKTKFDSLSPYQIIVRWLKWRLKLEQLALRQEMIELRETTLREKLLLLACQNIDVIFSLLKKRGIDKAAELSKKLKISIEDSRAIWQLAVGRLDRLAEAEQLQKLKALRDRATQVKKDFANPKRPVLAQLKSMEL